MNHEPTPTPSPIAYPWLWTLALALLGVAANHLRLPLLFGVDLIFGSLFVGLALVLLGWRSALLVALAASGYTLVLWGHGYAMLIFMLEALFLSLAYRRGWRNLVLIDACYWLLLGMPLALLCYRYALSLSWPAVLGIVLKQPFNGMLNLGLAMLMVLGLQSSGWRQRLGLSPTRLNQALFASLFTLLLGLSSFLMALQARMMMTGQQSLVQVRLEASLDQTAHQVALAEQQQWPLEQVLERVSHHQRLALLDANQQPMLSNGTLHSLTEAHCNPSDPQTRLQLWRPCQGAQMQRWQQGHYWQQQPQSFQGEPLFLRAEVSALDAANMFARTQAKLMAMLLALAFLSGLVSLLLSRLMTNNLAQLRQLSQSLAKGLPASAIRAQSNILEYQQLADDLYQMQLQLQLQQGHLEQLVAERTNELQENEQILRQVTESTHDVFWLRSLDLQQLLYISPSYATVFGQSCASLYQDPDSFLRAVHPDDAAGVQAVFADYLQSHHFDHSYRIVRPDGQVRWLRAQSFAVYNSQGEVVRHSGVAQDVTASKLAEEALAESAHHTQAILDSIVDGVITINDQGIMLSANPAAERIFGYPMTAMLGNNVNMLMPSPDNERHDSYLSNYRHSGEAKIIGIGREVVGLRANGELFAMELAVAPVFQQGLRIFVGTVRDISERKRVDKLKNEFVSTVSHELRTPLTAMIGALGLTLGSQQLSETATHLLTIALQNGDRLKRLINDLLDLEKIIAGKIEIVPEQTPLLPLLQTSLSQHQTYAVDQQVQLQLQVPESLMASELWVDPQRLLQILANLLSNAIKFSPRQGQVTLALAASDSHLRLDVRDQGAGISNDYLPHLFEKFSQGDASDTRKKGGTGLGLAISKALTEQMGGRILVQTSDQGSCFSLEFIKPKKLSEPN